MCLEPKQMQAINLLLQLNSSKKTAQILGVDKSTVYRWLLIPEFKEELMKRSQSILDIGIAMSQALAILWASTVAKRMKSEDETISLKACALYTPYLCKHITQKIETSSPLAFGDIESLRKMAKEIEEAIARDEQPEQED